MTIGLLSEADRSVIGMTDYELSRRHLLAFGGSCVAGIALAGSGTAHAAHVIGAADAAGAEGEAYRLAGSTADVTRLLHGTPRRRDITDGKAGVPLALRLTVRDTTSARTRTPAVADAAVEIWHCDAWGYYSGHAHASPGGEAPEPAPSPAATTATEDGGDDGDQAPAPERYLRGYQITDADGRVAFTTIVPGWYAARAPHIHVRVYTSGRAHAGQMFFEDAVIDSAYARGPYARHQGEGPARLADDPVYGGRGARDGLLSAEPAGEGYLATLTLGVERLK
jgi:protocatechuate 3,4-dioxygenase beta subunit